MRPRKRPRARVWRSAECGGSGSCLARRADSVSVGGCHVPHSQRGGQLAAQRVRRTLDLDEQRAAERLLVDHAQARAGQDLARGQVAQDLGVGVGDAHDGGLGAGLQRRQARGPLLGDHEVGGRDRVAVRIVRRMAELGRDQRLQLVREHVLEHLGLLVDTVPRHAERLGQEELEQPVVADHLQRQPRAGLRQPDAAIALVRDQAELGELAHHRARGRGRDLQALGERADADVALAVLERVDRLRVVLDGG